MLDMLVVLIKDPQSLKLTAIATGSSWTRVANRAMFRSRCPRWSDAGIETYGTHTRPRFGRWVGVPATRMSVEGEGYRKRVGAVLHVARLPDQRSPMCLSNPTLGLFV